MAVPLTHDGNNTDDLAWAVIESSHAPVLLLDENLTMIAASRSFCAAFAIDGVAGRALADLGNGEWNIPKLGTLLRAAMSGQVEIRAYEMDLRRGDEAPRRLILDAHGLDYGDAKQIRLMLTVVDVTAARLAEREKDDLVREKAILLQELQHRVANSLQIISSILLQSARKVQSAETRGHLEDAHNRVISIATLQQQLMGSRTGEVDLHAYFAQLCESLSASMIHDHDRLSIQVSADDSTVDGEVSVSLGLIVTELVINALKHAFPGERRGKIIVDYQAYGADWALSVGDNGVGMPDHAGANIGLGTSIVEALARQLRARVKVVDRYPGTAVSIIHRQLSADGGVIPFTAKAL
jgi:two-component sensor histidine kinase